MVNRLLVRGARQLLTLNGPPGPRRGRSLQQLGMIRDGAALIENGIISAVGPGNRIENLAEARLATEINAAGRVVMPGFVDPQVDLFPSRFTGTPSKRIIGQSVNRILDGCLRHGTTTLEAKVGV